MKLIKSLYQMDRKRRDIALTLTIIVLMGLFWLALPSHAVHTQPQSSGRILNDNSAMDDLALTDAWHPFV